MKSDFFLRKANMADVKAIHSLLMGNAGKGLLLPRSLSHLYSHARDFFVLDTGEEGAHIVGCCALSIVWEDMAEICSLSVAESLQGEGWGRRLVESCLKEAKEYKISRVFTLTYQTAFFSKLGFKEVGKDVLPQKIWADCINCPKFPDCDEIAMLLEL